MTYLYLHYRGLMVGAFLVAAPIFDLLAGGASAGLMHLASATAGMALLAVSLEAGNRPRIGYGGYEAARGPARDAG